MPVNVDGGVETVWVRLGRVGRAGRDRVVVVADRACAVVDLSASVAERLGDDDPPQPASSAATSASIPTCWSVLTAFTVPNQKL